MKKFFTVIGVIVSVMFIFSVLGAFFGLSKFGSIKSTVTENSILYLNLDGIIIDGKHFLENLRKYRDDKHINRIEVFFAVEASGQICFMIGGRMKIVAKRAAEPERFTVVSHFKVQQIDNNLINGDLIAQVPEKI